MRWNDGLVRFLRSRSCLDVVLRNRVGGIFVRRDHLKVWVVVRGCVDGGVVVVGKAVDSWCVDGFHTTRGAERSRGAWGRLVWSRLKRSVQACRSLTL